MTLADSLESPLLGRAGFRHAFFTRRGGVSEGPYRSLNLSLGVGDNPANVALNLERAGHRLGVSCAELGFLSQVHGAQVQRVASSTALAARSLTGDALVSEAPGVAVAVRTADCVPVLIADSRTRMVGAIHAGWRGLVAGVIGAAVTELRALRPDQGRILAAIGPHISVAAFEVSDDVAEELHRLAPEVGAVDRRLGPRPHVDLRRLARAQLCAAGVEDECIDDVLGCTFGDPELFFSYRRDGAQSGRHLSAILAG